MSHAASSSTSRRPGRPERLSRERIVAAAVELADRDGLDGLSMRRLGQHIGVDPMALYHHIRDKDALLAAMVDHVLSGIPVAPPEDGDWRQRLRTTVLTARSRMLSHPWLPRVLSDVANPPPAVLVYLDAVLGIMRDDGFSVDLMHHAIHVFGSRILGFSQDLFDESPGTDADEALDEKVAEFLGSLPRLAEVAAAATHDGRLSPCDDDQEFNFAFDILVDGLEARRLSAGSA